MTPSIVLSVNKLLNDTFELSSNHDWVAVNSFMFVRPYFNNAFTEVWLVTVTVKPNEETAIGIFKQHSMYGLEP